MRNVKAFVPFIIAPPLVLAVLAIFGSGTGAAVAGLVLAGVLGGLGAWFVFEKPQRPAVDSAGTTPFIVWSASAFEITTVRNGDSRKQERHVEGGAETRISRVSVAAH
jgi:hypothetical protein